MKNGFSLLELLFTIVLASILLLIAIPAYKSLISQNRSITETDQLIAAINFARSEAIKRHSIVTLCKSNDGSSCSGQWQDGWIVFVDKSAKGQVQAKDDILQVYKSLSKNYLLAWNGSRSESYLQIGPTGSTHGQDGTFVLCEKNSAKPAKAVVVSQAGRVRVDDHPSQLHCTALPAKRAESASQ